MPTPRRLCHRARAVAKTGCQAVYTPNAPVCKTVYCNNGGTQAANGDGDGEGNGEVGVGVV